nr:MAG TPA: hypothetical protein [Caudoviricetes sp.]
MFIIISNLYINSSVITSINSIINLIVLIYKFSVTSYF